MYFTLFSLLALPQFPRILALSPLENLRSLPLKEAEKASYHNYTLVEESVFPGPWERYIKAPANKTHIFPQKVWKWDGDVSEPDALLGWIDSSKRSSLGPGGMITFEFEENIAGRVCFDIEISGTESILALSYAETAAFAGRQSDASTDRSERDLPLHLSVSQNGTSCVGLEYVRGAFKFLTISIPEKRPGRGTFWHRGRGPPSGSLPSLMNSISSFWEDSQQRLGFSSQVAVPVSTSNAQVSISSFWVNCTAFPSNRNPRAYTGYFDSSSELLNRIWYAGAYSLGLNSIDPNEGSAGSGSIAFVDENTPAGFWNSSFKIANGSSTVTGGAKRDRVVWPNDLPISVSGIAVSTYDMISTANALDTLFAHQYGNGKLPFAGPPKGLGEFNDIHHLSTLIGAYNYVLYSGDMDWLRAIWAKYLKAVNYSIRRVDDTGLLLVDPMEQMLRPGMTGHNLQANAMLGLVLMNSYRLADFLADEQGGLHRHDMALKDKWLALAYNLAAGMDRLYCPNSGLYSDNTERRNCGKSEELLPQDGNSWLLYAGISTGERLSNVSAQLRERWLKHGAPAPELPNTIFPLSSSYELLGHCSAANFDAAVELMELMWGYMLDGTNNKAFGTNSTFIEAYRIDGHPSHPLYKIPSLTSHSHSGSTGPTTVLTTEILGIKLLKPGGREWIIEPHLTKWLSHVSGGFSTILGKFEVKVRRMRDGDGRAMEMLEAYAPPGTSGTIGWGGRFAQLAGGVNWRFLRAVEREGEEWEDLTQMGEWIDTDGEWVEAVTEESGEAEFVFETEVGVGEKIVVGAAKPYIGEEILLDDDEWWKPERKEREEGVVDWEALKRWAR